MIQGKRLRAPLATSINFEVPDASVISDRAHHAASAASHEGFQILAVRLAGPAASQKLIREI
jgi:hypothetical protein